MTTSMPTIFLDRDGVLVVDHGYVGDPKKIELLPGVAEALSALRQAGFRLVVVTNQSGIARGYYSLVDMKRCHNEMVRQIREQGGPPLDGILYCPHHDQGHIAPYAVACRCRKPAPGMLEAWERQHYPVDRDQSWMVGDKPADVEAGQSFGIKTAQIKGAHPVVDSALQFDDLNAAAAAIIRS